MKILQVISYFYPAWSYGGPPRSVYELSKELVKRGHQVTVFTTDALDVHNRVKEKQEFADGIEIRRFRNLSNYIAFHHRIFLSAGMPGALRREIRNYDIVHLNDFRTLQNLTAYNNAVKSNIPYVIQAHGSLINILAKRCLKNIFDARYGSKILRDAARFLALNTLEIEQYQSRGVDANKIDIIPNGVNLKEFKKLLPRGGVREKHGLDARHKVILYLGRLHKIKGVDLLITAFADVSKELDDARLVVAGPDDGCLVELKDLTEKLGLNQKVVFTGPLFGDAKLAAYVDADIYALTSSYDMFPTSILEALACGTPVVVTDRCGIADVIKDKAGLVVPYEKEPLAQALANLLSDEKLRNKFSHDGKELVQEQFNWTNIAQQIERVYQKASEEKSSHTGRQ
jgi:glycosyltransferase involved in cell wall biosynthesis